MRKLGLPNYAIVMVNASMLNESVETTLDTLIRILETDEGGLLGGNPPIIDHINSLAEAFANLNTNIPANNPLLQLSSISQNLENIEGIQGLETSITSFNSSLDFSTVDNYTSSIENLKTALEELNEVLAESNDTYLAERLSAGELLQDVGTANRATADKIETLNTTLLEILNTLRENNAIDSNIERNTRVAGMNLGRGIITR